MTRIHDLLAAICTGLRDRLAYEWRKSGSSVELRAALEDWLLLPVLSRSGEAFVDQDLGRCSAFFANLLESRQTAAVSSQYTPKCISTLNLTMFSTDLSPPGTNNRLHSQGCGIRCSALPHALGDVACRGRRIVCIGVECTDATPLGAEQPGASKLFEPACRRSDELPNAMLDKAYRHGSGAKTNGGRERNKILRALCRIGCCCRGTVKLVSKQVSYLCIDNSLYIDLS